MNSVKKLQFPGLALSPRHVVALGLLFLLAAPTLPAATTVRVQTMIGQFEVELYEHAAPAAVAQFLANVESGAYHFTMIHYALGGELRGGLYRYESCIEGPVIAAPEFRFPVQESGVRNSTGTLALFRDPDDPTLFTNEWLISLVSNAVDESSPFAPVAIGEISSGMELINFIHNDSTRVNLGVSPSVPTLGFGRTVPSCSLFRPEHVYRLQYTVESVDPAAEDSNSFDAESAILSLNIDAGASGLLRVDFALDATEPQVILRALPETLRPLEAASASMAVFEAQTGTLTVPEIRLLGEVALENLAFDLSDADALRFTLVSFEQPES